MTDMMAALPAVSPSVAEAQSPRTPFNSLMQHPPTGTLPPPASWWPVTLPGSAPPTLPIPAGSPAGPLPALPCDLHPVPIEWLGTTPPAATSYTNVPPAFYDGLSPGTLTIGPPMTSAAEADCLDTAGTERPAEVYGMAPTPTASTPTACPGNMAPAPMVTDTPAEPAVASASAPAVGAGASWSLGAA